MGDDHQSSSVKAKNFNSNLLLSNVVYFMCFVIGVSIGISVSFYVKYFSLDLQATLFSTSYSQSMVGPPSPPLPPPLPSTQSLCGSPVSSMSSLPVARSFLSEENKPSGINTTDDEELFWQASLVPRIRNFPHERVPKIAFMFLTKGPLPLAPLWDKFFRGYEQLYTIYVHTHPAHHDSAPEDSVFHGRRIPSKPVEWGKPSMIDAERRLIANALLDFSNERFVLLSESCIPLFNFTTTYGYFMNSNESFIGSFDDPRKSGRGRYNPQMFPAIAISDWRKGSQWFVATRALAIEIIADQKYYQIFSELCSPPCYMDEHYIPTLVNILATEKNSNRSTTWVDWSRSGPHPERFIGRDISSEFLDRIRFGTNCTYNGNPNTSMCFMFARKFMRETLEPLLQLAA